jgi:hypothetical protein
MPFKIENDAAKSVMDDTRVTLQIVASLTSLMTNTYDIIYDQNGFTVHATELLHA